MKHVNFIRILTTKYHITNTCFSNSQIAKTNFIEGLAELHIRQKLNSIILHLLHVYNSQVNINIAQNVMSPMLSLADILQWSWDVSRQ